MTRGASSVTGEPLASLSRRQSLTSADEAIEKGGASVNALYCTVAHSRYWYIATETGRTLSDHFDHCHGRIGAPDPAIHLRTSKSALLNPPGHARTSACEGMAAMIICGEAYARGGDLGLQSALVC